MRRATLLLKGMGFLLVVLAAGCFGLGGGGAPAERQPPETTSGATASRQNGPVTPETPENPFREIKTVGGLIDALGRRDTGDDAFEKLCQMKMEAVPELIRALDRRPKDRSLHVSCDRIRSAANRILQVISGQDMGYEYRPTSKGAESTSAAAKTFRQRQTEAIGKWYNWYCDRVGEEAVPHLIEAVGDNSLLIRELANQKLVSLTAHDVGYRPHLEESSSRREEARRQWLAWYQAQKEGKAKGESR